MKLINFKNYLYELIIFFMIIFRVYLIISFIILVIISNLHVISIPGNLGPGENVFTLMYIVLINIYNIIFIIIYIYVHKKVISKLPNEKNNINTSFIDLLILILTLIIYFGSIQFICIIFYVIININ